MLLPGSDAHPTSILAPSAARLIGGHRVYVAEHVVSDGDDSQPLKDPFSSLDSGGDMFYCPWV